MESLFCLNDAATAIGHVNPEVNSTVSLLDDDVVVREKLLQLVGSLG